MRSPLLQLFKFRYSFLNILEAPAGISISCCTLDSSDPFGSEEGSLP